MATATEIHRVTNSLWVWQAFSREHKTDLASSAYLTPKGLILVDPIPLADDAREELLASGSPAAVLLTNANHERDAQSWREHCSLPIWAPAKAVQTLEIPVDLVFTKELPVDWTIIDLEGGGVGETAFFNPQDGGTLIIGDAIINLEATGFDMLPRKYCSNAKQLRQALQQLRAFKMERIVFAHGLPITTRAFERLAQLLDTM